MTKAIMSERLTPAQHDALVAYSEGRMAALDLRRGLADATYGEVLQLLSEANLPLPRASQIGREETIARARAWLFPADGS